MSLGKTRAVTEPSVEKMLGKYRIERLLGQGGMGFVYAAFDTILHRRVAIKVLPKALAQDSLARKRFVLEARAAARLNHPNVVTVHDVARDGETYFIAMELITGGSVAAQVESNGRLDWRSATRITADACRGLRAAHAAGLIHRDIKPSNLMIGDDGSVKLADFGLSKAVDYRGLTLTGAHDLCGTPLYMSPEQCRCDEVNDLSDIYSLGATYYALLVGRPPYEGEQPVQVMFAHCSGPIPDPRVEIENVPEACASVVRRSMAKNPADRFKSAAEMLEALEASLVEPVTPPPLVRIPPRIELQPQRKRRSRRNAMGTAGWVTLVATCLGLIAILTSRPDVEPPGNDSPRAALQPPTKSTVNTSITTSPTETQLRQRVSANATPIACNAPVSAVELSQDGRWLLVGEAGPDCRFKMVDLHSGKVVQDQSTLAFETSQVNRAQRHDRAGVWAIAMSPSGDQLVLGTDGPAHGVWSLRRSATGMWQLEQKIAPTPACSLAFSVQGQMFAAAFSAMPVQREHVRIWDSETLSGASPLKSLEANVSAVAFSALNGLTFLAGDEVGDLTLFHVASKREHSIKTGRPIEAISVSADQEWLAIVGDGRLEIRDIDQLSQAGPLAAATCRAVIFAPNGSQVLTAGSGTSDREICIWDSQDLQPLKILRGHTQTVTSLAVSRDGKLLASGSDDQSARLWNLEVEP